MSGKGRKQKLPISGTESVDAFMSALEHPHKEEIALLRRIILSVDPMITEAIKWKVPSFRTTEYFATMHLRAKAGVGIILHFGAKKRDDQPGDRKIDDSGGLLEWLAEDRAMVTFSDRANVVAREADFSRLLRQWIRHV